MTASLSYNEDIIIHKNKRTILERVVNVIELLSKEESLLGDERERKKFKQ